ncbi:MAG: hypothetical protein LBI63_06155 [Candidatus Ancillula sp.]|jgi:hypothetical protein|nr:hypothetical protein [Candidatus Ancillula sp.]
MKNLRYITLLVAFTFVVSSCGQSSGSSSGENDAPSAGRNLTKSDFKGPYASEFYSIYKDVKMDSIANVLADSDLSVQDIKDIEDAYSSCMLQYGYKTEFDSQMRESLERTDGKSILSSSVSNDSTEKQEICYQKTSLPNIQMLYNNIKSNPNKEDMATLIASCLSKKGLAPQGYTADEYKYDNGEKDQKYHGVIAKINGSDSLKTGYIPEETADQKTLNQCQNNPLD